MSANTLEVYRVEKYGEDSFRAVIGGRGSSHYAYVLSVNEHEARINAEWLCKSANEYPPLKSRISELEDELRIPAPKVTKPTPEEWYESWKSAMQVSGDERWEPLYALALRQELTKQTEEAK